MYTETQRLANQRYREKKREEINLKERLRYSKMKCEDPEKYEAKVTKCSKLACVRSKERTMQNQFVKQLMKIAL
jgi:hypothetical protein